jgi:fibronectin-binding autotransporter adhesin
MKTSRSNPFVALAVVSLSLAAATTSFAASGTWLTTSGNWSDGTKWSGGTVADASTFTANFTSDITANTTVTLDTNRTIGNLSFNDTGAAGDSNWILASSGGSVLSLNNGSSPSVITKTSTATIDAQISGSNIRIDGSGNLTLTGNNTGITGNVALNGINNTNISNANALGSALITFSSAAVFGGTTTGITIANNIAFSGGNSWWAGTNGLKTTGTVTLSGANQGFNGWFASSNTEWASAVNLGANKLNVTSNQATAGLVISGTLSGTNGLAKTGPNTLTLSGNNASFSGATSVTGGTLALDYTTNNTAKLGNGAMTLGGGAMLRFKGNASAATTETNSGGLTILGGGAIYLDTASGQTVTAEFSGGSFTSTNGGLYVGKTGSGTGLLRLGGTTANTALIKNIAVGNVFGATDASNYIVGSSASTVTGANDLSTWTSGTKQYTSSGSAFTSSVGAGVSIDGITFNEAAARTVTIGTGNTLTLSNGIIVTPEVANNASSITGGNLSTPSGGVLNVFNADTQNALTISSVITDNGGTSLVKNGAGRLTLSGANTYAGGTIVYGGSLNITGGAVAFDQANSNALGTGTSVTVGSGATLLNSTDRGVSGGQLTTRVVALNGGTLNLANQDYFYKTEMTGGSISGAGLYRVGNLTDSGLITTFASATTSTISAPLDMTFRNLSLNVADGAASSDLTISSVISQNNGVTGGAKTLTKSGAGTLTLSSTNTYTGGTTINGGTIDITGGGGTIGAIRGTVTVNTGGTLRLSTGDATGYNTDGTRLSVINLVGGTLNVNTTSNQTLGSATINMTGGSITGVANSNLDIFAGSSAINTLASATSSTIDTVKLSIRQTAGLTFTVADGAAASDLSISSVIASNGGFTTAPLIKAGAGTLTLSGISTYTGATSVSAGTLLVNGTLGNTAVTVSNGATLGGTGIITGSVAFSGDSMLNIADVSDGLDVTGAVTFGSGFGFDNISGWDYQNAALGTYTLLSGGNISLAGMDHVGLENAFTLNNGNIAYFQQGSLQAVIAVPETGSALLGGIGLLLLLRRRR